MTENSDNFSKKPENVQKSVTEIIIEFLEAHYPDPGQMKSVRAMTKEILETIGVGSLNSVHIAMNKWRQIVHERNLARTDASEIGFDEIAAKLPDMLWQLITPLLERARRQQFEEDAQEMNRLREENEQLSEELDSETLLRENLAGELQSLTNEFNHREEEFHRLEDRLNASNNENKKLTDDISGLREQLSEMTSRLESIQEKNLENEKENLSLKSELIRISTELKHLQPLQKEAKEAQVQLARQTTELALAKQQYTVEKKLHDSAAAQAAEYRAMLESVQKKCDEAIANAAAATSQKEFLLETIETLKASSGKKLTRRRAPHAVS